MLVPRTWAEEQERGQHCSWRGTCACQQICCCSYNPRGCWGELSDGAAPFARPVYFVHFAALCVQSVSLVPQVQTVTRSCCLDACSSNGEMGNGWREVEWNSVYANSCHLQDRSRTGLETTCDLLFKSWISKGRSPFRRIILISSFSHPDFQSNWKMYLMSPSLRE